MTFTGNGVFLKRGTFTKVKDLYTSSTTVSLSIFDWRTQGNKFAKLCHFTDFAVPSTPVQDTLKFPIGQRDKLSRSASRSTVSPLGKILKHQSDTLGLMNEHWAYSGSGIVYLVATNCVMPFYPYPYPNTYSANCAYLWRARTF